MKWRWLVALLVLGAVVFAFLAAGDEDAVEANNGGQFRFVEATPSGELIDRGDRESAPSFTGTLLDGVAFDSDSLAGDIAVVNFWGQWCPPCRVETPEFQTVYDEVRADGVQFLGINVKDDAQLARAFLDNHDVTYPSVDDPRGEVALIFRDFPPSATPSTILLDRDGDVAAVYLGAVQPDDLRAAVDALLAEG